MVDFAPRIRRTQYLIAKSFQLRFALLLSGVGVIVTSIIGFILYGVLARTQTLLADSGVALSPSAIEFLQDQRSLYLYSLFGTFIGVTLILMMLGIFVSHRLAGPIFALTRKLNDLSQGNFNALLTLRKGDEFQNVKDKFNTLVKALQNQVKGELIKIHAVLESVEGVLNGGNLSAESSEKLRSVFHELQSYYNYKKSLIDPQSSKSFKPTESSPEDEVLV